MARMSLDTAIRLSAEVKGGGNITKVQREIQSLGANTKLTGREINTLRTTTLRLAQANNSTIAGIRSSIGAFRGLQEQARIGSREFQRYGAEIQKLEGKLRGLDGTAKAASRGLSLPATLLAGAAGGIGAAVAMQAANAGRSMVGVGLDAESAAVRLRALTSEFGEYQKAQEATARIANTLRISNTEAQDSFASLYASLRPTGISLDEIEKAFIGFSAAVRNSGATAQESSAALIQLKQALASGVLQGEELRSIREQAPLVAQAIAAEMGVTIGSLKDLAAEGKVTTDIVLRALNKLNDTQLGKLNEQFDTGRQAIKDFNVAAQELGITLAKVFGPTAVSLLRGFTDAVKEINAAATAFRSPTAYTAQQVLTAGVRPKTAMSQAVFNQGANELFAGTSGAGGVGITGLRREAEELAKIRRQSVDDVLFQLMQNRLNRVTSQNRPSISAAQQQAIESAAAQRAASASAGSGDAAEKAAKAAEKAAKAAEAAGRKYEAEQIRMQARLAENQLQINEGLQQNTIELDNQRYENSKTLALKQFEFNQSLQSRVLNLWSEGLLGPARAAAKVLSEFMLGFSENTARVADAQRAVNDARRALQQAETVHKQTLANMTTRQRIEAMEAGAEQVRSAGVGMGGQATFGSTGRVFNARGWVHGHFQNMNRDALIQDTVDVVMGLLAQGVPTELGSGRQFRQGMTRAEVQSIVRQGIAAHKKYASGIGAIDVFVPEGTRVPLPLSSVANLGGAAGYSGNLPRGTQLMHLDPRSRSGTTGAPLPMSQRLLPGADMPGFQPLPVRDVSGEGNIQQARERLNQAEEELKLIKQQNDELRKFDRKELTQKLTQGLIDQNYELETSAQDLQLRNRLLMEGVRSEVIDGELQKARLYRDQSVVVAGLQEGINAIEDADDKAAAIAGLEQVNQLYAKQIELIEASVAAQIQQGLALNLYIGELKRSLDEMQNIEQVTINVSKTIESELSSAMSGAVSAVVTGSESVKQTLGNMFKNIGEAFVKMATDIIAKQIVMIALQSVLKALGGPSFGGGGNMADVGRYADSASTITSADFPTTPFANGGIMSPSGPLPLKAYSRGGVASTPQVALFGEGSMNEAYVPLPDGRRIPVALQAPDGNRGDRMRELMGASPAGSNASPVLSMSFETTTINGVEYVSRDQLESAMAETRKRAANDGAKRGMSMTLDRLQQSPATRSKVGIR